MIETVQDLIQQIHHDQVTIENYEAQKVMVLKCSKFLVQSIEDLEFEM